MKQPESVIELLSSSLNRRDEGANIKLAQMISVTNDHGKVIELIDLLSHKDKAVQHDCIKVLYEIGALNPLLIIEYLDVFKELLNSKNNRLQWGAMAALKWITTIRPEAIYNILTQIINASDKGSVITRDNAIQIMIQLSSNSTYSKQMFSLLNEQLLTAPPNQLPAYAEKISSILPFENYSEMKQILESRLDDIEKESKKKRILKVIKQLSK